MKLTSRLRRPLLLGLLAALVVSGIALALSALPAREEVPRRAALEHLEAARAELAQLDSDPAARHALRAVDDALAVLRGDRQPASPTTPAPRLSDDPFGPLAPAWDPFLEMDRLREMTRRMFDDHFFRAAPTFPAAPQLVPGRLHAPDTDLVEEQDRYVVSVDLPGMSKPDIAIEVEGRTLRLSGTRDTRISTQDQERGLFRQERRVGRFERVISLPGPVDEAGIVATYEDGVLRITLPKKQSPDGQRLIPVQ
jgi:HSP20 family protein